ncbi:hypothetical protein P12x_001584 [Tundrisphaera lichenicola]|uniref:hypothetical protein n=1 Tax=Tundrisphaera lichenicola TaxID=2029860 RepID=UPI003EC123C3
MGARSRFLLLLATTIAISVLPWLSGCSGDVPTPKAFVGVLDPGGQFGCEVPKGWQVDKGGKADSPNSFVKCTQGNVEVKIVADFAGSLFGDMARASGNGLGEDAEPPVARVHPMGERQMKEEFSSYEERDPKPVQAKLGEGRRSTFIASGPIGGKIYGYRATYLSGDRRISVVCNCPATNWKALKPAFEHVINSLHR